MYPQGGFRNPYSVYGIGDRSQTSRQPSRVFDSTSQPQSQPQAQSQPQPQPQPRPQPQQQQVPKPEAKKEEPPKPTQLQPQAQAQPQAQQQVPKPEAKKEESPKPTQPARQPSRTEPQVPRPPTPPRRASSVSFKDPPPQPLTFSAIEAEDNKNEKLSIVPADQGKAIVKGSTPQQEKSLQQGIKEDITNLTRKLSELHAQHKLLNGDQKQPGQADLGVRVITLAGENRGATMDLGSESRNNGIYDSQKVGRKDNSMNEENQDAKGKESKNGSKAGPVSAYVNSNVQSANNSILYNSTCAHRDPGVHLALSNSPVSSAKGIGPPPSAGKEIRAKPTRALKDSA